MRLLSSLTPEPHETIARSQMAQRAHLAFHRAPMFEWLDWTSGETFRGLNRPRGMWMDLPFLRG